ncbi:hypothetical protein ABH926_006032 [Catenulispora sp. GP43]
MEAQVIESTTVDTDTTQPEAKMTLEELKAWILAEGTEEFELFARCCWG